MTTEQTLDKYFQAIHKGGWQEYVADDFTFVVNSFDRTMHGKDEYLRGAGNFFQATTAVDIRQKMIDGDQVALIARYDVRSPKGTTGTCDVAEFLTFNDGKLTASSIFFDTKAFGELIQS
jgi:ketosteroid isomerase-like protein